MDVLNIIAQTTVPIIFISAIGLLALTYQNRYGRVKDCVYTFQKQKVTYFHSGEKEKALLADQMLSFYQKEAKMIKNSMIAAFISVLFVALTSFSIMLKDITQLSIDILLLSSFALAVLSLVISIIFIVISFVRSVKTLNYEIENDDHGIRFGL
ncbi:MAG: DUF2721 domain-containing protein [Candidatus Heimdallarchaeaceae archaeon]